LTRDDVLPKRDNRHLGRDLHATQNMLDKEPADPTPLPPLRDRKPANAVLRRMCREEHPAA